MARGGKRERAGRPPKAPNKASADRQARVAAEGPTPHDVLILRMRYFLGRYATARTAATPNAREVERLIQLAGSAAKEAAPYVHPTFKAIAVVDQRTPVDVIRALFEEIAEIDRRDLKTIEGEVREIERTE